MNCDDGSASYVLFYTLEHLYLQPGESWNWTDNLNEVVLWSYGKLFEVVINSKLSGRYFKIVHIHEAMADYVMNS